MEKKYTMRSKVARFIIKMFCIIAFVLILDSVGDTGEVIKRMLAYAFLWIIADRVEENITNDK